MSFHRPSAKASVALLGGLVMLSWPADAWAYVDPGLAATLIQALFAIFFGSVAAVILRPWRWLRVRIMGNKPPPPSASDEAGEVPVPDDARD